MSPDPTRAARHRVVVYGDAFADCVPELSRHLGTAYTVSHVPFDTPGRDLEAALAGAIAVIAVQTNAGPPFEAGLLLLQVPGIGWDGVDPLQVPVTASICTVGGHETAVAEYCVAQMLEWNRRLFDADRQFRRGSWARSSRFGGRPDRELAGATVGIIGFGAIGRELARLLSAFNMRVLVANRSMFVDQATVAAAYPLDSLQDMLSACDFAVAAIALTPETRGLIGADLLAALGPEGVLVNVARGPVVDEDALWEALTDGRLGGAVLDVWYRYPDSLEAPDQRPAHHDFASLPNVLMTPHISGWTAGTVSRRVAAIAENIRRAAAGQALVGVVAKGTRP